MGILREEIGLYIHVPFCVKKCPYCDFKSIAAPLIPERRYAESLKKELGFVMEKEGTAPLIESVYLGGGTPSIFKPESISFILGFISGSFGATGREVTIEANPETVDLAKLRAYRASGINRLSIGFQALDDRHLEALGRAHDLRASLKAFREAREAGFGNIGVDLMFGIPGQSLADWKSALERVIELRPEHISLYGLTIEEGTPFFITHGKDRKGLPGEEAEAGMYLSAVGALKAAGYRHYEVSNFALPGFESRHNSRYWTGGDYIGLGSSAHSYAKRPGWGRRWWNIPDPYKYMDRVDAGEDPKEEFEELTKEQAMLERAMLGLRMVDRGIDCAGFKKSFGVFPWEAFSGWLSLEDQGLIERKDQTALLTEKGLLLMNEVLERLS